MEVGGHGDPGETAQGHVVEEYSTPSESVIIPFQRMEENTVKENECSTAHVTLRTVQITMVRCNFYLKPRKGILWRRS